MIKVFNTGDITEANIICSMLAAHDIDARVDGQYLQGGVGELVPMDFSSISVDETQVEQARQVIAAYEADNPNLGKNTNTKSLEQPAWLEALIFLLIIFGILSLYLLFN